ncbi:hypothetical protein J8273_4386 [Carpediemonas membranifera]|uniref:Uncharacterized protein n=2 Tax=Carpediemonas membranifera TaxID=201153 RepID=A0A8J6B9A5_9EUKA|nr:hypothetical protein J8273_8548 [Carpediemonas membranifera]KAG9392652.1 hypothetical protein J8273_6020 [Carpediemonas membranifera]KAG9394025.1 hypothetical protein J8273_4386 [Carpediemonas membranifera]|eukprot:KAG9389865.1 hypothetical protein J8273_8548 [Carpediemonas membranifera]
MTTDSQQWIAFEHLAALYTTIKRGKIETASQCINMIEDSCVERFVMFWLTTENAATIYNEKTAALQESYGDGVVRCSGTDSITRTISSSSRGVEHVSSIERASSVMQRHLEFLHWGKIALSCSGRTLADFATQHFPFRVSDIERKIVFVMVTVPNEFMVWYKALVDEKIDEEEFTYYIIYRLNSSAKDHMVVNALTFKYE